MPDRLRGRASYANVMSTIAVFVALGGSAFAVARNSVGTPQLKKNAVKTKKIANNAVRTKKIANNAVNAAKVLNGSLGAAEFSSSIPVARVTRTADQPIQFQSNSDTTLAFDSERYDTAAMHDNATNNSRLTAPVEGIYAVTVQITWSASAIGNFRSLSVLKNGAASIVRGREAPASSGTLPMEATTEVRLQAGDYVEARVFHDDGAGLTVLKQVESSPEFSMTWLAPGP